MFLRLASLKAETNRDLGAHSLLKEFSIHLRRKGVK